MRAWTRRGTTSELPLNLSQEANKIDPKNLPHRCPGAIPRDLNGNHWASPLLRSLPLYRDGWTAVVKSGIRKYIAPPFRRQQREGVFYHTVPGFLAAGMQEGARKSHPGGRQNPGAPSNGLCHVEGQCEWQCSGERINIVSAQLQTCSRRRPWWFYPRTYECGKLFPNNHINAYVFECVL